MTRLFYLAYGEGQFGATATGVFSALVLLLVFFIGLGAYAYTTYPTDQK